MLLLSSELMSFCAASTNGCLDLRRRAFAPGGQVSAEWSRCPGSMAMARLARESVAPLPRSSAGWMPTRMGRFSNGVGGRHPVTIRKASLMIRRYEHCGSVQERSTLRLNASGQGWLFATLLLQRPNRSQQAASGARRVMSAFCEVTRGVGDA